MGDILLVTGGGRGIGAATSLLAAKRGYAVAINYLAKSDRAEAIANQIRGQGGKAEIFAADVSREKDVVRLFAEVDKKLGRVAALVNCAGILGPMGRIDAVESAAIETMLGINVTGTLL
jgi:NAD(P)-dependent dehydrogenase (short-subunit alcohol dehydrogenase family)